MTTLKTVRHIASATAVVVLLATGAAQQPQTLTFVVTSDAHYGIARAAFRGATNVGAHVVNRALVEQIGRIPDPLDFVVETGDVANREEAGIPPAAQSWKLFETDYLQTLHVPVFVVPGNHEASNAVGFHQPMTPKIDASAMVGIYNLMMRPATPLTTTTYDYARDKVLSSRDIDGVHFVFVQVWPDSVARAWLDKDLARVSATTPVILFTHDQPDVEAKHFRNPNPPHDVNPRDRFENLLADTLEDGRTIDTPTASAQRALASFVRRHPNIVAYFHGNSNWNEFYDWHGPDNDITLHVFRLDSPMKGKESSKDERKLSFQVATIDMVKGELTVRECLWNTAPNTLAWGAHKTISIRVTPRT